MKKLIFLFFTFIFIVFINSRLIGQNIIIKDMKSQATVTTTIEKQSLANSAFLQSVDTSKAVSVYRVGEINKRDTVMINYRIIDKKLKMKFSNDSINTISVDKNPASSRETADVNAEKIKPVLNTWVPESK